MDNTQEHKDITHLSNFKTFAQARYYFEVNNEGDLENLVEVVRFGKKENLGILFVASGTNMLFAFDEYNGIVVKNNLLGWKYNNQTKILESYSSDIISDIAESLEKDYKQEFWHRFIGLPGSVGGAIFGNAGCFGLETENNFVEARVMDLENGQVSIMSKKEMNFSYRSSILKEKEGRYFLISTKFDLSKKIEKYSSEVDNIYFREHKQPKGNTCGSFFKNPSRELSAGSLIEQVGLKGHRVGGAYFSELHANFLMSTERGSYKDLLELIHKAKERVKEKFNIDLVNEVRIITN